MAIKTKTAGKAKARKVQAKDQLCCDECGLVVDVVDPCGCADLSNLTCCEQPMKKKKK